MENVYTKDLAKELQFLWHEIGASKMRNTLSMFFYYCRTKFLIILLLGNDLLTKLPIHGMEIAYTKNLAKKL